MSTCNFAYENRCIVVTNDDYEMDNLPPMGKWLNGNCSYPSRKLSVSEDFDFFNIVITSGYYQDACIDYMRNDCTAESFLGSAIYYSTKQQLFDECKNEFGLTEYQLRKICGRVRDFADYDAWIESAYDKITEYLVDKEETKVNTYLDGVKNLYGYAEIICTGVMSNGEGVYKQVS